MGLHRPGRLHDRGRQRDRDVDLATRAGVARDAQARSYDSADVLANCQYNLACGGDGTLSGSFPITHPGGRNLYAVAVCVRPV